MIDVGQRITDTNGVRYEVEKSLGEGGQGKAFAIRNERTGQRETAKVMHPAFETPETAARLHALVTLKLSNRSPAVAGPTALLDAAHGLGVVMPFAEGEPLETLFEHPTYSLLEALGIGTAIARVLAGLENIGISHGDLSANNIMIAKRGPIYEIALFDFDNAVIAGAPPPPLTGQEFYFAPELFGAQSVPTLATDRYALGVLMHELLLGRHPYAAAFGTQVSHRRFLAAMQKAEWPEDPRLGRMAGAGVIPVSVLPRTAHDLFRRALSADPASRPRAMEWVEVLRDALAGTYACACGAQFVNEATRFTCPHGCGAGAPTYELRVGRKLVPLVALSTTFGRADLGGIPTVSRQHAVFRRVGFGLRVECLSSNGLAVKGAAGWVVLSRGESHDLAHNDTVRFVPGEEATVQLVGP